MSKYLFDLKANQARVAVLDRNIEELKKLAKTMQTVKPDIGMTVRYGEEKCHAEGTHSDPTAGAALYDPSEQISEIFAEIRKLMIERQRVIGWINIANAALSFLPEDQRMIVQLRAIEGMKWEELSFEYEDRTGHSLSVKSCRKYYYIALETMQPFFRRTDEPPQDGSAQQAETAPNPWGR